MHRSMFVDGVNDALFALIRSGLNIEDANLAGEVNWIELYKVALSQGVIAIVAEGVSKEFERGIEYEYLNIKIRQQFVFDMIGVEQSYRSAWQSAKCLAALYHEHGIKTYSLKGFVTSSFYPKPQQRSFCDFDCFLSNFELGNEVVKNQGIEVAGSYKHSTFNFEAIHVENHQFCTHFRGRKKSFLFELFLQKNIATDPPDYLWDSYIERPSSLFNALFLIHHARSHYFDERVSLRQVIDWAMLMKHYGKNGLDWKQFLNVCQEYGLLSFAQTMSRVARQVCHVQIPFDCPSDDDLDRMLLEDIFSDTQEHVEYGTGMKARCQVLKNKFKERWKYKFFSDQSFSSAIWQQLWGFITEKQPKRVG